MDRRLKNINRLLSEYSTGCFDRRLSLSDRLDETDAMISGINMLGEELKAITISRDYFTNIFNSVSDMVFVIDNKGMIADVNRSGEIQLGYDQGCLHGGQFNMLRKEIPAFFQSVKHRLKTQSSLTINDSYLTRKNGELIQVRIHVSYLNDTREKLILLTATDISFQAQAEKMIIRAIIDTQEKERQRLAKDLHDSLTQQLAAIKFYISSINTETKDKTERAILRKSNEGLTDVITDMRNICFNLMPRTLKEFGLAKAIKEFCDHYPQAQHTEFVIHEIKTLPHLPSDLAIDLYRVIQEIISNAVKHGRAGRIKISLACRNRTIMVTVNDNGIGFDSKKESNGMGLKNMESRVRSHNGKVYIKSNTGAGTSCRIVVPVTG